MFSSGEGGGGGAGGTFQVGSSSPETVQTRFQELDVFLLYRREFGPIDVTVGPIGFFIARDAQTFLNTEFFRLFGPFPTVGTERFERVLVRLTTSAIRHIAPRRSQYERASRSGQDA